MKKLLVGAVLAAAVVGGVAYAQVTLPYVQAINPTDAFQDIVTGFPTAGSVYATATQLRSWIFSGNSQRTTAPVLTSCITGGGTIVGTDYAFILTGGSTSSTTCTATFSKAFVSIPVCSVTSQTAYGTTTPSYTVSTTAVTITQASEGSEVYDVICVAQPGG